MGNENRSLILYDFAREFSQRSGYDFDESSLARIVRYVGALILEGDTPEPAFTQAFELERLGLIDDAGTFPLEGLPLNLS